jgi:hypothetical protein
MSNGFSRVTNARSTAAITRREEETSGNRQANNMYPCSRGEQNAQAQEIPAVPVFRKTVFPKSGGAVEHGDRRAPLCHRRGMSMAPRQRVLMVA